jgi:hypothetical protein
MDQGRIDAFLKYFAPLAPVFLWNDWKPGVSFARPGPAASK